MLTPRNVHEHLPGIVITGTTADGVYHADQSTLPPVKRSPQANTDMSADHYDYYTVGGQKQLTYESISRLALNRGIKIDSIDYELKDARPHGYVIVEAVAVDELGIATYGCAVEGEGLHALSTAFSKAQRQAISQLIPVSEMKTALGNRTDYQGPKQIDHYSRAFAAKMELDKHKQCDNKKFWKWTAIQGPGDAIQRISRPINSWSKLKKHPRLCARIAAQLVYFKEYPTLVGW